MSTDEGKIQILNPKDRTPIMKCHWQPNFFSEEIHARVMMYVENELKTEDVVQMLETVKKEIASFHDKVSSDLAAMENEWIEVGTDKVKLPAYTNVADKDVSTASVVGVVLATSPLWLTILAAGIGLGITFAGLGFVLSPVVFPTLKILGRDARKKKIIDEEYNKCHESIKSLVSNAFESKYGCVINKLIDKVTEDMLPKRIHSLLKMIEQLCHSRAEILENLESLEYLSKKVKAMEESASELNICLIRQKGMS